MKAYQWPIRSAAIVTNGLADLLLTSARRFLTDGPQQPVEVRGSAVKANCSRTSGAVTAVVLLAVLCGPSVAAAENLCDARLTVELSPSVPRASDDGFLSSLLNNHFAYHLELLRQRDSSVIEVDLTGPGPSYRCENVIESMRKDARVESVRVEST
jgi:hypothetical protein